MVQQMMASREVESVFNIPYHPQFNVIEFVFSDIKNRWKNALTRQKAQKSAEIRLEDLVNETFQNTDPVKAVNLCLRGWCNLLADELRCPVHFQGRRIFDKKD